MTRPILLSCWFLLAGISASVCGQNSDIPDNLLLLFNRQLAVFPQEKIYLHTDKPYYISGEKIWFRAHLADAVSHVPSPVSRYVYVELINPLDSVVTRVKIRQEDGVYRGYLLTPDDIPEGDYTMRAYTTFMRSQDENYFCRKNIRIGDPQARAVRVDASFSFESDKKITATFRFSNVNPPAPIVPQSVKASVNGGKMMNVKTGDDGSASITFNLPVDSRKRIMLLEAVAVKTPYRQFIHVPAPDNDFDVTFYPEGGQILQGTPCKMAFKAMKSDGRSTDITGAVYDQTGEEIREIKTDYFGMGSFSHLAEKGKTYHAICKNDKGQSKRFDLPAAVDCGYALTVNLLRDKIYISTLKPAGSAQNDDLYLLAHTRGAIHFAGLWDQAKNIAIIQKDQFPSGVLHFILFDAALNPVSERLLFINNPDQAKVTCLSDRESYAARSLVQNRVTVTDDNGQPLSGSFSVAVTSDKEVTADSTTSILTQLLLASDLRGHIENPAGYFKNTLSAAWALDLLMRTQGWRRYNVAEMAQGRFSRPTSPLEIGPEISGTVKSLLLGKPAENIEVTVMSFKGGYFDNTRTDADGRFFFHGGELPDSTRFIVSAVPKTGIKRMELILDRETFPERELQAATPDKVNREQFAKYADVAEQKYTYENGVRVIHLSEVTVSATRKPPRKSTYYTSPSASLTEEQIDKFPVTNIRNLLMRLSGVMITGNSVSIRGQGSPLLVIDDVPTDIEDLDIINVYDIAQIDVLKDAANTAMFGSRGGNGVIVIFTKDGNITKTAIKPFHIKTVLPLGYQQPVEFYAPKYDTPEKRKAQTPDLRTTIHWQPDVRTDSLGAASFDFYTADESTSYTIIVEGLAKNGQIIRQEGKLWRKD
jgi:TonB-dependent SusC/RagA subfamily outer membrane receptor